MEIPGSVPSDWSENRFSLEHSSPFDVVLEYPPEIQRYRLEMRYKEIQRTLKPLLWGESIPMGTVEKIVILLQDFDEIVSVFDKLYNERVVNWFKRCMCYLSHQGAVLGSGKAAYVAGKICFRRIVEHEKFAASAIKYFNMAVRNGTPLGALGIASVFLTSKEPLSEYQQGYIRKSLEKFSGSNPDADVMLAMMCYQGKCGFAIDFDRAFKLMKSYEDENGMAQLFLGRMFKYGRGCDASDRKAFKLLSKSALGGNSIAQKYLDEWFPGVNGQSSTGDQ